MRKLMVAFISACLGSLFGSLFVGFSVIPFLLSISITTGLFTLYLLISNLISLRKMSKNFVISDHPSVKRK